MDPPRLASIPVLDRAAIPPVDDLIPLKYMGRSKGQSKGCTKGKGPAGGLIRNERDVGPHAFLSPAAGEDAGSEMCFQFRDVLLTPAPEI